MNSGMNLILNGDKLSDEFPKLRKKHSRKIKVIVQV